MRLTFFILGIRVLMLDEHIRNLLFTRLKKLGYHLIRVKINNIGAKKTLQIMAERSQDRRMDLKDCTFLSREISSFLLNS